MEIAGKLLIKVKPPSRGERSSGMRGYTYADFIRVNFQSEEGVHDDILAEKALKRYGKDLILVFGKKGPIFLGGSIECVKIGYRGYTILDLMSMHYPGLTFIYKQNRETRERTILMTKKVTRVVTNFKTAAVVGEAPYWHKKKELVEDFS